MLSIEASNVIPVAIICTLHYMPSAVKQSSYEGIPLILTHLLSPCVKTSIINTLEISLIILLIDM